MDFSIKATEILIDTQKSIIAASVAFSAAYIAFFKGILGLEFWSSLHWVPVVLFILSCFLCLLSLFFTINALRKGEIPVDNRCIEVISGIAFLCFSIGMAAMFVSLYCSR